MALSRQASDLSVQILIGEAYKAQKLSRGAQIGNTHAKKQSAQNEPFEKPMKTAAASAQNGPLPHSQKTSQKIAKSFNVGEQTVKRAEKFLDGLNAAEDRKRPGIAPRSFGYFLLSRSIVSSMARLMNSVVLLPSFFA